MPSLKVIALISGGKDSLFSILHCLANGHEVVALANLHPPTHLTDSSSTDDDLNSYMYQTVGHSIIPLYETALDIPLYRQEISGSAVNTERDYSIPSPSVEEGDDETESLIPLLKKVLATRPDANAVSTGAILSTYQRTRIESVALRLGLVPLSYLWQYPFLPPYSQSALLHDMATVGQDARIIKVASGGLDQSFLWENVADEKTVARLSKAVGRFGENGDGAVLGEGGEFETLAIDGPRLLWKGRIEVEGDGVVGGDGGEAIWKAGKARVVRKEEEVGTGLKALRIPDMWDVEFKRVLDGIDDKQYVGMPGTTPVQSNPPTTYTTFTLPTNQNSSMSSTLLFSNLTSPSDPSKPLDPIAQIESIIATLRSHLASHNLASSSIVHTTLLLRSISLFPLLNPIYSTLFPNPNPPSRVTVACGPTMPSGVAVMLSAIISKTSPRKGLHVQGRSYWAPANIGPYSQAISIPLNPPATHVSEDQDTDEEIPSETDAKCEVVYVAGQIPLIPASMEALDSGFKEQAVLALQHLWRVGRAVNVRWWTVGVAYISGCSAAEARERVRVAQMVWRGIHEQTLQQNEEEEGDGEGADEAIDPWDAKNRTGMIKQNLSDTTLRSRIPDREVVKGKAVLLPPVFVVQVEELPRDVDIEWWSVGLSIPSTCHIKTHTQSTELPGYVIDVRTPTSTSDSTSAYCTIAKFYCVEIDDLSMAWIDLWRVVMGALGDENLGWDHCTLFAGPELGRRMRGNDNCGIVDEGLQWVPCQKVWGKEGKDIEGVLVGRAGVLGRHLDT
ncbi:adenine nucleotide alpha hydrolases-like protein [Lindgomyces ingoldianus]|uniref:Adenine nucleotide alpha hydrolases-like protein n=1 Tax=Lindgomyces ingoldianus TaxID=673940 RepID=A0ACB6R5V8_9PLEO|nr:adenine nucleotide alpha hydrolases-like protein [Lindgomyces ingoldianus]KAF2474556.1 adenine nucleotide alpha hydrolases-like protein [Lindgomyces ingoldianus]